jgi:anti-anti-sigma factor
VVAEDLDLGGAARLRNVVAEQFERGVTDLEIDMERCEFVDSTGISMLLTARARLSAVGGSITLVNVSDQIKRALTYAGVYEMLTSR